MGIVNLNIFIVFIGFWLVLYFNGLSVMDNLDKLFFIIVGFGLVMVGVCCLNNYID